MKRSFALIGFSYLIALMLASFFSIKIDIGCSIFLFLLFIVSLFVKNLRQQIVIPVALIIASVGFLVYSADYHYKVEPTIVYDGIKATVSGQICELPYKEYNRYYYEFETDYISSDLGKQNIKVQLSSEKALEADVFDEVTMNVCFYLPKDSSGYSSKTYLQSKGIFIKGYIDEYSDIKVETVEHKPVYYYVIKFRQKILSIIRVMLPSQESSMVSGILIGDKKGISEDIKSSFRRVGVSHVLAVSGMHLSIIAQYLMMILALIGIPKKLRNPLVILGIIGFMAIAGFSQSISRAGIMAIIYFGANILHREADSYNSLGFAVFLICLINPFAALDISLILSICAVLGILILNEPIQSFIKSKLSNFNWDNTILALILNMFSISLAATLFTIPVSMLVFKRISLIAPIANVIILLPTALLMYSSLFSIIFYIVRLSLMGTAFSFISGLDADYMIYSANLLAKLPYASVSTDYSFVYLWLAFTLLLFSVALYFSKKRLIRISALLSFILLLVGILSYQISNRNITSVAILDEGDGLSVILTKNGHAAIVSSGGEKYYSNSISDYLDSRDINAIDCMLVCDSTDKGSRFSDDIALKYRPSALVYYSSNEVKDKLSSAIYECENAISFDSNASISLWSNVKVDSCDIDGVGYIYLKVNNVRFLISSGEIDERNIPNDWKNCDFIVTSSGLEFVNCKNHKYIVLSDGFDTASDQIYQTAPLNNNIIATAGDGNLVVDCIKDNYICIRRKV